MKPKNQKQFNWSYTRFYLMWMLTTLLALVPMVVLFSGWVKNDDCARQTSSVKNEGVEIVNYEEVANSIDSLITIVKDIDIGSGSRDLRRTLIELDNFRDDFLIEDNKKLSKKLRTLAGEIYGLTEQYEDSNVKREKANERVVKDKNTTISTLEGQVTILRSQLNNR